MLAAQLKIIFNNFDKNPITNKMVPHKFPKPACESQLNANKAI